MRRNSINRSQNTVTTMISVPQDIRESLSAAGQEHLIQFWSDLNENEQHMLLDDLRSLDFAAMNKLYTNAMNSLNTDVAKLDNKMLVIPATQFECKVRLDKDQLNKYFQIGLKEISMGRVAVVLMAGGQGTRLGVAYPKGMYSVGLQSRKTLFQLQAERIRKVEQLAADAFPNEERRYVTWYIMTSGPTETATKSFLLNHNYFGLRKENIVIFQQGLLPCFDFQGKIILDEKYRLSLSPDGNGGIYRALVKNGILVDMNRRGVEFIHCHSVDNILVKVADPLFIGYCVEKGADCGAKVVEKTSPTEPVGVVCVVDGKFQVVEYSEINSSTAHRRDTDGNLKFHAANICNHYFTREFLHRIAQDFETDLKLHVAKKKISYINEKGDRILPKDISGVKVEKFVFDVFMYSDHFVTWQVPRSEDFSPVKNSDDVGCDCPATARRDLHRLHRTMLEAAGGTVAPTTAGDAAEVVVEISPLVSYDGEGLDILVRGKTFTTPVIIAAVSELYGVTCTANGDS